MKNRLKLLCTAFCHNTCDTMTKRADKIQCESSRKKWRLQKGLKQQWNFGLKAENPSNDSQIILKIWILHLIQEFDIFRFRFCCYELHSLMHLWVLRDIGKVSLLKTLKQNSTNLSRKKIGSKSRCKGHLRWTWCRLVIKISQEVFQTLSMLILLLLFILNTWLGIFAHS